MNEQITAYVLNELSPEERAAFEAQLQQQPELQAQVAEMQTFCQVLDTHVTKNTSTTDSFTAEQRAQLLSSFRQTSTSNLPKKSSRRPWLHPILLSSSAIAACLAILLVKYGAFDESIPPVIPDFSNNSPQMEPVLANRELAESKSASSVTTAKPMPTAAPAPQSELEAATSRDARRAPIITHSRKAEGTAAAAAKDDHYTPTQSPGALRARPNVLATAPSAKPAEPLNGIYVDQFSAHPSPPPSQRLHENYQPITENTFLDTAQHPLSTFSVHTDGASYANVRRFLNDGQRPPANAVRIEELVNYFPYDYEPPAANTHPFSVKIDIAEAPWQPLHRLARIAIKGYQVQQDRKAANLVFLIDVSGSMNDPRKLPLVKQSLELLTQQLRDNDRVAIVTYAGDSKIALENTPATDKPKILNAIQNLHAGGSTNGAGGIQTAYQQARNHLLENGINRVILCSDGDFNVGTSNTQELEKLISQEAKSNIFLSVLGFGTGNLNEHIMETLATKGNGNHAYIDSLSEARKVLVDQLDATLMTIAKDVKIQIEFNPNQVASYRLIGYENRSLQKEDFNNDKKDAGEIGAGHTVTALYEIVPANLKHPNGQPLVDELKYSKSKPASTTAPTTTANNETMTVKLRYKQPESHVSQLIEIPVTDQQHQLQNAPGDFKFATAVAGFGMLLRNSSHSGELTWDQIRELALQGKGPDPLGYRGEFLQLIDKARSLTK